MSEVILMSNSSANQTKKTMTTKNFLESLKELGSNMPKSVAKDLFGQMPRTAANQFGFGPRNPQPNPFAENTPPFPQPENKEKFKWSGQEFTNIKVQERMIFKRAEQEVTLKIEAVRSELANLIKITKKVVKHVEIAATQAPANPGIYHVNFFEKLREFIILFQKNITESDNWLSLCNQKGKKKGHYWNQVQKSGTKFMFSAERQLATQTG